MRCQSLNTKEKKKKKEEKKRLFLRRNVLKLKLLLNQSFVIVTKKEKKGKIENLCIKTSSSLLLITWIKSASIKLYLLTIRLFQKTNINYLFNKK